MKSKRIRAGLAGLILALLTGLLLPGCGRQGGGASGGGQLFVCRLGAEEDALLREPYEGEVTDQETMMDTFVNLLQNPPEDGRTRALLPPEVRIERTTISGGLLTIDFSETYKEMEPIREVLVRAGVVRTFVQLSGVSKVRFTAGGHAVVTPGGETLGIMDAASFVEDNGNQINAISHTAINLYFTDATGKYLLKEARSIYYSASKPLEWAILERVIAGPKVEGNYPTVPPTTQIISVSSEGGICYVNLTQTFATNALPVDERIPIYSIVNSIIDNCRDITAVQFSIDGESSLTFRQNTDLSKPFEADMTLTEQVSAP